MAGDLVIVISYGEYEDDELDDAFTPRIVFVDARNRRVPPASREEFEEGRHEA
jgi:aspartate 1-decarboxylase